MEASEDAWWRSTLPPPRRRESHRVWRPARSPAVDLPGHDPRQPHRERRVRVRAAARSVSYSSIIMPSPNSPPTRVSREIVNATSPTPGLQKQPVRSDTLCRLATRSSDGDAACDHGSLASRHGACGPLPITASALRFQARKVRSSAKPNGGSERAPLAGSASQLSAARSSPLLSRGAGSAVATLHGSGALGMISVSSSR